MEIFDIKEAVLQIKMILHEKAKMKDIKVHTQFVGFNNKFDYFIQSD